MEYIHLKLYNSNDIYMSPKNEIMDANAVLAHFPAVSHFTFVVQTDQTEQIMFGFYNINVLRSKYNIDVSLDNVEAVEAIENAWNTELEEQEAAARTPSAEERTAAALEFQTLMNLPDIE